MEVENKDQDLGLSIRASLKFFQKFYLGLVVVNIYDDVIFKYIPEIRYNNINPHTLYVLVYNSHCYRLNSHENSFVHKLNLKNVVDEEKETYENLKNKLSTNFFFRNFDKEIHKILLIIWMIVFNIFKITKKQTILHLLQIRILHIYYFKW